jgi:SAM-dependent methyltransferase
VSRVLARLLRRYAVGQAAAVADFVVGSRVLDLGAAEAYVPAALSARTGAWACGVDVGVFRREQVPYAVYDGRRLPFRDATFDTTLLLLTLHHCEAPEVVLDEAIRVTRHRLVVTESVYRTPAERFWLDVLDGRLNRFRHGGAMRPALHVRRPEEWRRLFETRALAIVATRWLGSAMERLVHHPLLWALEVAPSRA